MPKRKQAGSAQQIAPAPTVLEPLLKMPDMMRILQLSKPKIYELIAQGLPSLKIDGARRFQPSAVKAWIEQQAAS